MTGAPPAAVPAGPEPEWAKEFLLVEYSRLGEFMVANESLGETRMNIFIGLITAVIAAIAAIGSTNVEFVRTHLNFVLGLIAAATVFLLMIGLRTFDRLLKRDETTKETQRHMDWIRHLMRKAVISGVPDLAAYKPYAPTGSDVHGRTRQRRYLKRAGRLALTAQWINGCLGAGLGWVIGVGVHAPGPDRWTAPSAFVAGLLLFAAVVGGQNRRWHLEYEMGNEDIAQANQERLEMKSSE